jgi:hypothetical protein
MEIYKILDRFELLYPDDERLSDLRRAYIDQDLNSIFRLSPDTDELRKAILEKNIHSIFRLAEGYGIRGTVDDLKKAVVDQNLYSIFRLLPSDFEDLKKAVCENNIHSIFRLLANDELKGLVLNDNTFSLWKILQEYTNTNFVYAFKTMNNENVKFDEDCFSRGQLQSKIWLVNKLKEIGLDLGVVFLCAGWYGTLATMIFESGISLEKIRSFDIDTDCIKIAEIFNKKWVVDNWKFKASCQDIHDIKFDSDHVYRVYKTNGEEEYLWDSPDTVINTSCEHIENFEDWYDKIPNGKIVILQCNDYKEIKEHVNCHDTLDSFAKQTPLEVELYSGELKLEKYTRFMRIGIR